MRLQEFPKRLVIIEYSSYNSLYKHLIKIAKMNAFVLWNFACGYKEIKMTLLSSEWSF